MKILYFTNKPAPYRVEFFNILSRKHDVTVLFDYVKNDHRDKKWYEDNKYDFNHINIKKNGFFQLKRILKENYDIVVIGTYASKNAAIFNLLLKMKHIKFFINADGGFIDYNESFISKFIKKFFISKATYYLSSGIETNKYLEYYGATKKNIFLYPFTSLNSSDILDKPVEYSEKEDLKHKLGYSNKFIILSVGSFLHVKGYDILLRTIKNYDIDNVHFVVIGGGHLKQEYLKFKQENNINNIEFIDFMKKKELFNYYKMADAFIMLSRGDVWGLVINEAMALGLPIIASNRTIAALELLDSKYIFELNEKDVADKINIISKKGKDELYEIGLNNLKKIREYTIEKTVEKHIEIFQSVLGEK